MFTKILIFELQMDFFPIKKKNGISNFLNIFFSHLYFMWANLSTSEDLFWSRKVEFFKLNRIFFPIGKKGIANFPNTKNNYPTWTSYEKNLSKIRGPFYFTKEGACSLALATLGAHRWGTSCSVLLRSRAVGCTFAASRLIGALRFTRDFKKTCLLPFGILNENRKARFGAFFHRENPSYTDQEFMKKKRPANFGNF